MLGPLGAYTASIMSAALDDSRYLAFVARDARFDGQFFVAVRTTGIFCRPVCTVRKPLRRNVLFFPSAAAAFEAGFRPCLRCRPELAPDLARSLGATSYLQRALRLIADGALDHGTAADLAARIGVTDRHLRRLFDEHLGAAPIAVAQVRRLLFAKQLIEQSALPLIDVAIAAGYGTVRRFNDAIRSAYARTPTQLRVGARTTAPRAGRPVGSGAGAGTAGSGAGVITLHLAYLGDFDADFMFGYLASRCFAGVESVAGNVYRRAFVARGRPSHVEVRHAPERRALRLDVYTPAVEGLSAVVAAVKRVFDLDADLPRIEAALAQDRAFAHAVARRPGLRVPGAWAPFEIAVRAILGQQVSVAAATTFAARIVSAHGALLDWEGAAPAGLTHAFPTPAALADAPLERVGVVRQRADAIRALARRLRDEPAWLESFADLDDAITRLCALPGVGPWTAQYIAMRGLGEPDAFPHGDLGLMRAFEHVTRQSGAAALHRHAERWRPWRAYAAMRLWHLPLEPKRR